MRALYLPGLDPQSTSTGQEVLIDGDQAHHLLRVVRIKLSEELLLLNGQGALFYSQVISSNKRNLSIQITNVVEKNRSRAVDLAVGVTQKDSMEEVLRAATELGFSSIFPLFTQYSQNVFDSKKQRFHRIIESALIQSNNPFYPQLHPPQPIQTFDFESYGQLITFSSHPHSFSHPSLQTANTLIIIGPEGGFAPHEEEFLRQQKNSHLIHLPTPILRTPTAISTAMGYVCAQL